MEARVLAKLETAAAQAGPALPETATDRPGPLRRARVGRRGKGGLQDAVPAQVGAMAAVSTTV